MKTIIVSTDFSDGANAAIEYACELASHIQAKLWVVNVYTPAVTKYNVISPLIREETGRLTKEANKKLAAIAATVVKTYPEVACETACLVGGLVDTLQELVRETGAGLLVMGTRGAGGLNKLLFGTNTVHVMEKVNCPVLAVPFGSSFKAPAKILFATDFNRAELNHVTQLVEIARPFEAQLMMTHVITDPEATLSEEMLKLKFSREVAALTDYPYISYFTRFNGNVSQALESFAERESADWLSLLTHDRSFLERLYNPSFTRQVAYHARLPLLALKG